MHALPMWWCVLQVVMGAVEAFVADNDAEELAETLHLTAAYVRGREASRRDQSDDDSDLSSNDEVC